MATVERYRTHKRKGTWWRARLDLGRGPDGRRIRRSVLFEHVGSPAAAKRRAQALEERARHETNAADGVAEAFTPFRYAADAYLAAADIAPKTRHTYRGHLDRHILPILGDTPLADITTPMIGAMRDQIAGQANARTGEPLKPRTVNACILVVSSICAWAVDRGLIERNPATGTKKVKAGTYQAPTANPDDLTRLLASLRTTNTDLYTFVLTIAATGMRRGEAAALRWGDIDLAAGTITIRHNLTQWRQLGPTKTHAARTVDLVPATIAELAEHRQRAVAEWVEWTGQPVDPASIGDWFCWPTRGTRTEPRSPDTFSHDTRRACEALGLTVRLHAIRHLAATRMIAGGLDPRTAADVLGHASPSVTLNVYAHAAEDGRRRAAQLIAGDPPATDPGAPLS